MKNSRNVEKNDKRPGKGLILSEAFGLYANSVFVSPKRMVWQPSKERKAVDITKLPLTSAQV